MSMLSPGIPTDVLGGVGLTFLKVYEDRPAPDGQQSGCAHVHAVTDEAYFVVSGVGFLELHDLANGFRRLPLAPGAYVQFTPGTIHRVVSTGGLEVMVVIGNAGLAERGDARIYFGAEVDSDPNEYRRLADLPKAWGRDGALERRDASVSGYANLMELLVNDPNAYRAEIERFVLHHFDDMRAVREDLSAVLEAGPMRWVKTVSERIEKLPCGIADAGTLVMASNVDTVLGMCGTLRAVSGLRAPETTAGTLDAPGS